MNLNYQSNNISIENKKRIILFPFGRTTKKVIDTLQMHGYLVVEIWDNFVTKKSYQDIPIKKPHHVEDDLLVSCCGNISIQEDLIIQAKALCKNVTRLEELLYNINLSEKQKRDNFIYLHELKNNAWRRDNPDALILKSIETPITERCSLRCRDCANLMQYFQHPKDEDIVETLRDMDRIINAVDRIEYASIVGGEPFLNKNMYQYVNYFVNQEKVDAIHVFTNGTIIPQGENLKCLRNPKVYVMISNYGDISRHANELAQIFEENEIAYYMDLDLKWNDCASIQKHGRTVQQLEEVFSSCCANRLLTLRDGKLFACPFLANGWALHALPIETDESIELKKCSLQELREAIVNFQKKPYFQGCDYCQGRDIKEGNLPAAIQIKRPLPYKQYN